MAFAFAVLAAIQIAFPHDGQRLPAIESCYAIGSVPRGVTIGGISPSSLSMSDLPFRIAS